MRTQTTVQQEILDRAKRLTLKIGTNSLIDVNTWQFKSEWFESFIESALSLRKEFAIVTSGAIGLERAQRNGYEPKTLAEKQALSAFGQPDLHHLYKEILAKYDLRAGQALGSRINFLDRDGLYNSQAALSAIRELGGIPIINENDCFFTEEIKLGDNDRLAAYAAHADNATTLILITDVNGLYTDNPAKNPDAKHIPVVECLDQETRCLGKGSNGNHSKGGMETKLMAAAIAAEYGIDTIIVNGGDPQCLSRLFNGDTSQASFIPSSAHPQLVLF